VELEIKNNVACYSTVSGIIQQQLGANAQAVTSHQYCIVREFQQFSQSTLILFSVCEAGVSKYD